MAKKSDTNTTSSNNRGHNSSALAKFHLSFEYDRTWNEAKEKVQLRPAKTNHK